ncbi:hypothetical protein [Xenorhabdus sp. BG5]|uniref:hypothetical protein n=1 Tax=Xenorhabdus sp. BG5 TaxID=2782014 RepID=UPI001880FDBB|nr:hypothetical protein [Xenorhabdus sp. BG5]MBE8596814.1 hypothetical protein [Xenorhabdus sp. BG5]
MRFDYNPYAAQDAKYERDREEAAYQEMLEEERGDKVYGLYSSLPEDPEGVLSPKMIELFGVLLDKNSDALDKLNDCLYDLSLLEIKRREAA